MKYITSFFIGCILLFSFPAFGAEVTKLLNVSYDPTREFYESYNKFFANFWKQKTGQLVEIAQSHGGSGAQARAVIDGLEADVVTLALAYDIDLIAEKTKLLPQDWQKQFPNNSCPYNSTIVFLVRKGNPKHIMDWPDLIQPNVQIITPNPKTSGGARWNYMAAWGYAYKKYNNNEGAAKNFMAQLYKNVPVLDTGARGATNTFVQRGIGDVLIAWENEALLVLSKTGVINYQIVRPSISILTEPPVAVMVGNTEKKGTTNIAKSYLQTLYTPVAQNLIAKFFYRPFDFVTSMRYAKMFPKIPMFTIQDFGGWQQVQKKHFADGGIFDQIYQKEM